MSGVVPRSRVRRAGIVYLVLFVGGVLGALVIAPRLDDPATVVAALLPTGAGAYLAWCAYRADRAEAAVDDPGAVADRLAVAVARQWESEARMRRLSEPYPLPVSWRGADPEFAITEESGRLAGRDGELGALFAEHLPHRRLLVLGGPGSGKTVLLVRLLLALTERRGRGEPVPVLFPLASWNPAAEDLRAWMERRLIQDHADLAEAASGAYGDSTLAGMLLERRLVLPVLDGFDELPDRAGASALHRIAAALPYGCGLVLSSRPREYLAALRPRTGVPARPAGLAGIRLDPLDGPSVASYLLHDAGGAGTPAAERWAPVVAALGTAAPVAQALTNPLTVSLARSVYNPRPDDEDGQLPDPAALLRLPTRTAVEHHLLDAFVPAAYRPHPRRPCRWTADQAHDALGFLARRMEQGRDGVAELAWWRLHHAVPTMLPRVLAGVLLGTLGWLVEGSTMELIHHFAPQLPATPHWEERGGLGVVAAGMCGGLAGGLVAGAVVTLLCAMAAAPDTTAALVLHRLADGGALALVGVIISGFAFGHRLGVRRPSSWNRRALATGIGAAICYGLAFGNACGTVSALLYGLLAAAVVGDGPPVEAARPAARVRWHWSAGGVCRGLAGGMLLGGGVLLEGLFADVLSGGADRVYIAPADPVAAAWGAGQVGAVFAVACLLLHALRTVPVELGAAVDGRTLLANDRRMLSTCVATAVVVGVAVIGTQGWCAALWGSTGVWGANPRDGRLWVYAVGLVPALLAGLAIGMRQAAWSRYAVARLYLAVQVRLPLDLLAFLADAHEQRGVLRRVGAVYQFRHIELQHRLAEAADTR
ncbi:NACHT domain-containing protein [Streptomyces kroppenstedtii]|uniref:NACHT domain-containing protein n=1 Tax=Streptomyces kroppenstedtii TaxID=3051181 RepID=UPI0028D3D424|nr:NACHT domain-containing protein [Streptomyces sp. DSM 40484]